MEIEIYTEQLPEPFTIMGFCQSCGKLKSISAYTTPSYICASCQCDILNPYMED